MNYLYKLIIFTILMFGQSLHAAFAKLDGGAPKVLVLIICSDQFPIYHEFQKIWRSYMHLDPDHVEAYFIRGNPNLSSDYEVVDDVLWSKTDEGWPPASAGILNKTILSIAAMMPRINSEFDYVLRTNLSSVYNFPKLLKILETLPSKNCYFGSIPYENCDFASGSGFVISSDVAALLFLNRYEFLGNKEHDDVKIGRFLTRRGVPIIQHKRVDILSFQQWDQIKNHFPNEVFHFRTKLNDRQGIAFPDALAEAKINQTIVEMIYGIK